MDKIRLSGLAALTVAFGLGACSHTTVESPAPAASTGATVTTTTTATADTATRRDSAAGYQASGTTTSTTVATPSTSATTSVTTTTPSTTATPATSATVSTTTTPAAPASGMSMNGAQTLTLSALNNSGFTGTAVLTDMGDHTGVAVTLNSPANTNATADHNVAIRSGTCAAPGDKVEGLHDVEGNGQASNSEVNMRLSQLADGQHVIVVNENPGDRAIACVAIPSR
jgi:hypothetical protein